MVCEDGVHLVYTQYCFLVHELIILLRVYQSGAYRFQLFV